MGKTFPPFMREKTNQISNQYRFVVLLVGVWPCERHLGVTEKCKLWLCPSEISNIGVDKNMPAKL